MTKLFITFDDGRIDNYQIARPLLNKYGINGTFFLIGLCFSCEKARSLDYHYNGDYMSREMIFELRSDGNEMGSHSQKHSSNIRDIVEGHKTLLANLQVKTAPLSIPNSKIEGGSIASLRNMLGDTCSCIRIGRKDLIKPFIAPFYFLYEAKPNPKIYTLINKSNLFAKECAVIHSVPITNNTRLHDLESLIVYAADKGGNLVLMFHSILDDGNQWSWGIENFDLLLAFLQKLRDQKRIDVCTMKNL